MSAPWNWRQYQDNTHVELVGLLIASACLARKWASVIWLDGFVNIVEDARV